MTDVRPSSPTDPVQALLDSYAQMPARPRPPEAALEATNLIAEFAAGGSFRRVLAGISFSLIRGEIVAIVGESGSGKSILLQSILGLARGRPGVVAGQVVVRTRAGEVLRPLEGLESAVVRSFGVDGKTERVKVARGWTAKVEARSAALRGRIVGLALQNGRASLDPFWRIGPQIRDSLRARHHGLGTNELRERGEAWLRRMDFQDPRRIADAYPHELSGGEAQRAMLAVVLAREPEILFLDEITTGLDVSLQAKVMDLVQDLHGDLGFSALMITHDLGIARAMSRRTLVMKHGRLVQSAGTQALFEGAVQLDPYAAQLLDASERSPRARKRLEIAPDGAAVPILRVEAQGVTKSFARSGLLGLGRSKTEERIRALSDVSLLVHRGECLALVGESGSGKTTLSRILVGLLSADSGGVVHDGREITRLHGRELALFKRNRTILFQNPYTSLNPAMRAEEVMEEALRHFRGMNAGEAREAARSSLEEMGLGGAVGKHLRRLSGGERRRIGLLRAMLSEADLIVLDEPTAGLDAVHRMQVAELIWTCRRKPSQPCIVVVSHDLGFVGNVADRIAVLYKGLKVEEAEVGALSDGCRLQHPYSRELWVASNFVAGIVDRSGAPRAQPRSVERGARQRLRRQAKAGAATEARGNHVME